jgi:hypothetical protein
VAQSLPNSVFPRVWRGLTKVGKIGGFMPFCTKCGTEVSENAQFCSVCGTAKQGEQKGNILGNNWNMGKTIISAALAIAFIAMFLPWLEIASSQAGGSITVNGWGSVNTNGPIMVIEGGSQIRDTAGLIAFYGILTFLVSLAIGIYAITRKKLINTRFIIYIYTVPFAISFLIMFESSSQLLPGLFLSLLSMIVIIVGVIFSNKEIKKVT